MKAQWGGPVRSSTCFILKNIECFSIKVGDDGLKSFIIIRIDKGVI
jgi:hypothetical protein